MRDRRETLRPLQLFPAHLSQSTDNVCRYYETRKELHLLNLLQVKSSATSHSCVQMPLVHADVSRCKNCTEGKERIRIPTGSYRK